MGIRNKVTGEVYTITTYDPTTGAITGINNIGGNTDLGNVSNVYIGGGNPGEVLSTDGAGNLSWVAAGGGGGGGIEYVYKTANYLIANNQGVLADTTGGAFTVTLPATPATGAQCIIADSGGVFGTNNCTVARNGSTIAGISQDLELNINGVSVQFVYDGTTWEVYSQIGGAGGNITGNIYFDESGILSNQSNAYINLNSFGAGYLTLGSNDNTNVVITTDASDTDNQWNFDFTGNLTIPGSSGGLIKTASNASIGIVAMDNGTDNPAQMMSWNVGSDTPTTIISTYASNATILTNVTGSMNTWQFFANGVTVFPSDLVGSGASPAPSINGFDSASFVGNVTSGNVTVSNSVTMTPTALGSLTAIAGGRAFVNDSNIAASGNFGNQVGNGGSNTVPVWSDGTNWYIG